MLWQQRARFVRRARQAFVCVALPAIVTNIVAGCSSTPDSSSLKALSQDPAMAVQPSSGTLVSSTDEFECRDRFDGKQPSLIRSYAVTAPRDEALASITSQLRSLGWTEAAPPGLAFTKIVDGQTVRLSLTFVNGVVVLTGDVPAIDFCK